MTDIGNCFLTRYGHAFPASETDRQDFVRRVDNGELVGIFGDVSILSECFDDPGAPLDQIAPFMRVIQPGHIDFYGFPVDLIALQPAVPVLLLANDTVVHRWESFPAFLDWLEGE